MVALTKLQLDNNLIEVIEGLDALVNLVWLGMLFNETGIIKCILSILLFYVKYFSGHNS